MKRFSRVAALFILTVSGLAACSGHRSAEDTAKLFLDQYLVAADQRAAIKLATGRAKEEIQKEIDLLSSMQDREQEISKVKPDVKFERLDTRTRPNGDVALMYAVHIKRPGVELSPREVFLILGLEGKDYKVKSFNFRSPTDNHTSNTP